MRQAIDTFLQFLYDGLTTEDPTTSIPVHALRRGKTAPDGDLLMQNAVNVGFSTVTPDVTVTSQQVSIDVVHDDELTALEWVEAVWEVLSSAFYTPTQDFTDPDEPTSVGGNIMWDRAPFKKLFSRPYTHYNCTFSIKYHN